MVCSEDRGHLVASVSVRGRVSRVTCPICGTRSSFKATNGGPRVNGSDGRVEPYHQTDTYRIRQLIMHASYGLGEVVAVIEGRKIDVLFADRMRRLVHSRA